MVVGETHHLIGNPQKMIDMYNMSIRISWIILKKAGIFGDSSFGKIDHLLGLRCTTLYSVCISSWKGEMSFAVFIYHGRVEFFFDFPSW